MALEAVCYPRPPLPRVIAPPTTCPLRAASPTSAAPFATGTVAAVYTQNVSDASLTEAYGIHKKLALAMDLEPDGRTAKAFRLLQRPTQWRGEGPALPHPHPIAYAIPGRSSRESA
jgi:hypothetical protein